MGVVRIDDELLEQAKEFLKKDENKYKYSSLSSFLNFIIHNELKELKKDEKDEKKESKK